ncbi:MAG: C39 family peptidase, partial [Vicinamibacteria bacterium]
MAFFWTAVSYRVEPAEIPAPEAVVLDVPFLPQGRLLCGGASVAMVLRYWGESDIYAEDFRELIREDAGGISTRDLVGAVRERGWRAFPIRADFEMVRVHLSRGRPLVLLLRASSNTFHYVVVTGYAGEDLVLHDPSVGPGRLRSFDEVRESWAAADFWTLLILPPPSTSSETEEPATAGPKTDTPAANAASACRPLVDKALELDDDLGSAEELLTIASRLCPGDAVAFRELAAIRFLHQDWRQAAAWAEAALELEPEDDHTSSLLAASRWLGGDREGALDAWNSRGEPVLDLVEIGGLSRTRQEVLYRYLSLRPGELLTTEAFRRARRRAADLPTLERARVSFEPLAGGRAKLVASVSEGSLFEPLAAAVLRSSVDALAHRTTRAGLSSPTGGGERLEASFRWWERRPKLWVSLASPGMLGLPGIARLEGFVERQSYAFPGSGGLTEEAWRGARLSFGDWVSSDTRAELGIGFEHERSRGEWIALRAAVERRFLNDRASLRADASRWFSTGRAPSFDEVGVSLAARSLSRNRGWAMRARLDARAASEDAPLSVWPGAGSDEARPYLLRGYPLLEGGVV